GFSAVRTVLATGNVILDSAARPDTVRATAERALRDRFGYDAWVLVYPFDDVAAISAAFPFERVIPDHHSYVTFVSDPQVLDELAQSARTGADRGLAGAAAAFGTFATVSSGPLAKPELTGVSETALLTLLVRATEARRPDGIIDDPMAVRLVDSIDFDFAKFGPSRRQDMALRAKAFDTATRRYLRAHPKATVVALAEGLQTSFFRLNAADVGDEFRWVTVDLAPVIELRRQLLPADDRVTMLAQSALDYSWMDRKIGRAHV